MNKYLSSIRATKEGKTSKEGDTAFWLITKVSNILKKL